MTSPRLTYSISTKFKPGTFSGSWDYEICNNVILWSRSLVEVIIWTIGKRHHTCPNLCLEFQRNLLNRFGASMSAIIWSMFCNNVTLWPLVEVTIWIIGMRHHTYPNLCLKFQRNVLNRSGASSSAIIWTAHTQTYGIDLVPVRRGKLEARHIYFRQCCAQSSYNLEWSFFAWTRF